MRYFDWVNEESLPPRTLYILAPGNLGTRRTKTPLTTSEFALMPWVVQRFDLCLYA